MAAAPEPNNRPAKFEGSYNRTKGTGPRVQLRVPTPLFKGVPP